MTQLAVLHKILRETTDFICTKSHTQPYNKLYILVVLKGVHSCGKTKPDVCRVQKYVYKQLNCF